jgi:hypothetical protein
MDVARGMWGRAWRVDTHVCERLGTRRATLLLCDEPAGSPNCSPIGWCSMTWHPDDPRNAMIDRLAWDAASARTEGDVWRAMNELMRPEEIVEPTSPSGSQTRAVELVAQP